MGFLELKVLRTKVKSFNFLKIVIFENQQMIFSRSWKAVAFFKASYKRELSELQKKCSFRKFERYLE